MFVGLLSMLFSTHDERGDESGPSTAGATPSGATASEADSRRAASLHAAKVFVVLVLCIGGVCLGRGRGGNAIHGVMADDAEGGGSSTSASCNRHNDKHICRVTSHPRFGRAHTAAFSRAPSRSFTSLFLPCAAWNHIGNGRRPPRRVAKTSWYRMLRRRRRRCLPRHWGGFFFFCQNRRVWPVSPAAQGACSFWRRPPSPQLLVIIAFAGLVADCRRLGAAPGAGRCPANSAKRTTVLHRELPPSPLPPPATSSSERHETEGRATTTTLKSTTLSISSSFVLFTELTINWNHIDGVNSIRSAG